MQISFFKKKNYIFSLFLFLFLFSIFFIFEGIAFANTSSVVYNYNYDRYNYSYIKYIHFYYLDYYSFNFLNFYDFQVNNYYFSKLSLNFYIYKYFFMLEDSFLIKNLEIFNFSDSFKNIKKTNFFILENYNYSLDMIYLKNFYFNKSRLLLDNSSLNFLFQYSNNIFGDLFLFSIINTSPVFFNYSFLLFTLPYYTYVYFSFVLFIFFFIYYIFLYIFFYKKFYIIGQFLTKYSLDTEDNHGGYLDYMEEQEQDLSFADNYYNIVKYEFNYLNYILFLNKYLLVWIFVSKISFLPLLDLGQFKNLKFSFFSEIFSKIEANFLAGLTYEDDFGEWAYFPYEHIVQAFPESNYYVGDAVFEYAQTDLAFDFSLVRKNIYKDFLHPLSLLQEEQDDELEYEEFFDDIQGFLSNYNHSYKILSTYKIRFKNIYKRLNFHNNLIENSLNYSGSLNSSKEIMNRIAPVGFEGFFIDWPYFREIINNYNIINNNYEEPAEDESIQEANFRDRERERILKREEDDLLVVEKHKLLFKKKDKSKEEILDDINLIKDSFKETDAFFVYNKIRKDIWKNYSHSNFFSIICESAFLQWMFRSNWLWSKFKVPLEYNFLIEDSTFLHSDKNLSGFFNSLYRNSNFVEDLYNKPDSNLALTNQLVSSYSTLETIFLKLPPYKNYLGFLLINPTIRRNKDLYLLNYVSSSKISNLIFRETVTISSFEFLVPNTYIFDLVGLPSGMVLSTNNILEDSLYSNNYIKEVEQVEVVEEEEVDFAIVKPVIYSISRFISFNYVVPLILFSSYFYIILKNIF